MGDAGRRFEKMADCDQETHTPPPTLAMLFRYSQLEHSSSSSSNKKRASDWIFSEETPSDITIDVGGDVFNLHKFPLVSKCGYLKKLLSKDKNVTNLSIEVADVSKAFQLVVNFCYGKDFQITIENIAALRCLSEQLEMTDEYSPNNLVSVAEDYIQRVALTSLPNAITVLRCSENLGNAPIVERVRLVSRCINAIAYIACNQDEFYSSLTNENHQGFMDCWAQDLTALGIDTLGKVLFAMAKAGFKQDALGTILLLYAQKSLKGIDIFGRGRKKMESRKQYEKRVILETIVGLLPKEARTTLPVTSLSMLLRAAIYLETTIACRLDLEKMISFRLDQATLDDLLIPSFSIAGDTLLDVDTVQRILVSFLESQVDDGGVDDMEEEERKKKNKKESKVGKLMEFYLAEISTDLNLSVSKFVGFAELIPEEARATEDGMYRAIDIYLKAHPSLNDVEKKKISSAMDCQRLSLKACTHAAHNQRLPVQTMVQVLYYEQHLLLLLEEEELQQEQEHEHGHEQIETKKVHRSNTEELSILRKQNSEMKVELMRMKLKLKEAGHQTIGIPTDMNSHNKPPLALSKKTFLKQIVRLNPFGARRSSDIHRSENSTAKGRDRRNSIS